LPAPVFSSGERQRTDAFNATMTSPLSANIAAQLIALLAVLMLVMQLLLVVQRMLLTSIRLFALQSLFLAGIAAVIGFFHGAFHVYVVAVLTLAGKVLLLPWLLNRQVRRIGIVQEIEPLINFPTSMLLCAGLALFGYVLARPFTSLERLGNNTVAVAFALVLTGIFLMFNRRKAISQVLAWLTVENGVMLAAIALTTYGIPLIVELGIFLDVIVAVMVLGILVYRIRDSFASMDTGKLSQLKG
jgi:hydrogenase-4 component E